MLPELELVNKALTKISCTLQQAFVCHWLLAQSAEWVTTTYVELASRPTRLCCHSREARAIVQRMAALKLLSVRPVNDGTDKIELQLNFEGMREIVA